MRVALGIPDHRQGFVERFTAQRIPLSDPRWHSHDELELNLCLRGRARVLVGEHRIDVQARHLLWLFPGQEHMIVWRSEDFALWVAVFRPELVQPQLAVLASPVLGHQDPGAVFHRRIAAEQVAALGHDCERLGERELPDPIFNHGLGWLLLCAWRAFRHADAADAADHLPPQVLRSLHFLQDDPSLGLTDLAHLCGVSAPWLSRLFHREMGSTVIGYRNRLRMQRFLDRYASGRDATEAALHAGFSSYSQCFKVARQQLGCSPRQWLQRERRGAGPR